MNRPEVPLANTEAVGVREPSAPAGTSITRRTSRGRLFRKYLILILSLVTIALLASGAITVYFSYQENKSARRLQHEKARRRHPDRQYIRGSSSSSPIRPAAIDASESSCADEFLKL